MAWTSPTGPRHQNIRAGLAWSTFDPWTLTASQPIMVHNPYATTPLPTGAFTISQHVTDRENGVLVERKGSSMVDTRFLDSDAAEIAFESDHYKVGMTTSSSGPRDADSMSPLASLRGLKTSYRFRVLSSFFQQFLVYGPQTAKR